MILVGCSDSALAQTPFDFPQPPLRRHEPIVPAQPPNPLPQPNAPNLPPESFPPAEGRIRNPEVADRYYVDVTAYGAKSDRYFDNTAAIQAAINAACTASTLSKIKPVLYFPPGLYVLLQPQLPLTNSPLNMPCTLEMEGAFTQGGAQFSTMAHGTWIQVNPGKNPNAAATITYSLSTNGDGSLPILRHLTIFGYNQAVAVYAVAPAVFEDVCLTVADSGLPDNTPLKVTDSFWLWFKGGCLQAPNGVPVAIFTAETLPFNANAEQLDGLVYMSDIIGTGDGFKYIQRVPQNVGLAGNFVFRNISLENAGDVFSISQTCTDCMQWWVTSVTLDHVAAVDSACVSCSIVHINAPTGFVTGLVINQSSAGNAGFGRAITVDAGTLGYYSINGCDGECTTAIRKGDGSAAWTYTGKVTLSGGTATLQFAPVIFWHGAPACVLNDENPNGVAHITTTRTSMTIIASGQSDIVDYACFPDDPYPLT